MSSVPEWQFVWMLTITWESSFECHVWFWTPGFWQFFTSGFGCHVIIFFLGRGFTCTWKCHMIQVMRYKAVSFSILMARGWFQLTYSLIFIEHQLSFTGKVQNTTNFLQKFIYVKCQPWLFTKHTPICKHISDWSVLLYAKSLCLLMWMSIEQICVKKCYINFILIFQMQSMIKRSLKRFAGARGCRSRCSRAFWLVEQEAIGGIPKPQIGRDVTNRANRTLNPILMIPPCAVLCALRVQMKAKRTENYFFSTKSKKTTKSKPKEMTDARFFHRMHRISSSILKWFRSKVNWRENTQPSRGKFLCGFTLAADSRGCTTSSPCQWRRTTSTLP